MTTYLPVETLVAFKYNGMLDLAKICDMPDGKPGKGYTLDYRYNDLPDETPVHVCVWKGDTLEPRRLTTIGKIRSKLRVVQPLPPDWKPPDFRDLLKMKDDLSSLFPH